MKKKEFFFARIEDIKVCLHAAGNTVLERKTMYEAGKTGNHGRCNTLEILKCISAFSGVIGVPWAITL